MNCELELADHLLNSGKRTMFGSNFKRCNLKLRILLNTSLEGKSTLSQLTNYYVSLTLYYQFHAPSQ